MPRIVIALYDRREEPRLRYSRLHQFAQMPLNRLGLVLRYHDINAPLPDAAGDPDVRGVITWLDVGDMRDPQGYLDWARRLEAAGKRFVVLGNTGVERSTAGAVTPVEQVNRYLAPLGVRSANAFVDVTYDARVLSHDPALYGYERMFRGPLPAYPVMRATGGDARVGLSVRKGDDPDTRADLVVVGPRGGYVAPGYAFYRGEDVRQVKWYLNPFEFFREAFATDDLPKPDTTTLDGRRIYYSHIDGDGWRNVTAVEPYSKRHALASEVIMDRAIRPFPDLPVTVGPIAGDLDPKWYGTPASVRVARELFALPQVEAGSHTYTHPFQWRFFEHYSPAKEKPFLERYARLNRTSAGGYQNWGAESAVEDSGDAGGTAALGAYSLPRAFAKKPFDLKLEIGGSVHFIDGLLPPGKHVKLLQWSGDTDPFPEALKLARQAGVQNINGGDTRYDREYPSVAWVAPLGREVGRYWQIYASDSNEETYTRLWTGRYFGFRYLRQTIDNTGAPLRLKPIDVYYHTYSGEKEASLDALLRILRYVRTLEICPIPASRFAAIGQGFYAARIVRLGPRRWRVENRGMLDTLRIDHADGLTVDFARSEGVIGMRHDLGSLYVALEGTDPAPVVAITDAADHAPAVPFLVQSRWRVYGVRREPGQIRYSARGFGHGEMVWHVAPGARYRLRVLDAGGDPVPPGPPEPSVPSVPPGASGGDAEAPVLEAGADGLLRAGIDAPPDALRQVVLTRTGEAQR